MLIDAPIRGQDGQGAGYFGAPRGTGRHQGVDVACYAGSKVLSTRDGTVSYIGKPYYDKDNARNRNHYRLVEVVEASGLRLRYFYVQPLVKPGDRIKAGDPIGVAQGLTEVYPGITDHIHFEVKTVDGTIINPEPYLT